MKLSLKLPLAFAAVLLLMLGAALYGVYGQNKALNTYGSTARTSYDHLHVTIDAVVAFRTQVQEWKNVLLRGKDPKALDRHWQAFNKFEQLTADKVKTLAATLPEGEARTLVQKFAASHAAMGQGYRKAFEAFKAADFDASVGDSAVRGMDREPSKLLEELDERVAAEVAALAAQAEATGQRAALLSVVLMLVVCAAGLAGAVLFSRIVTRPIGQAVGVARAVASGDLSLQFEAEGKDETAQLLAALKHMQTSLIMVIGEVRGNAETVATASTQIAQGNADLSRRTEDQASVLQQTAATMEELATTVRQNADNAQQANQLAQAASGVAVKGGEVVGQVVATMKGISESSRKIADIIGTIDGIAFQTNILALNAAVEAARAGEQGRGFAVVASEVRGLAQRSAEAAKEIKNLIGASADRVKQGMALVDQAGQTMGEVVGSIKRVTDIMGEISDASAEQSSGVAQVGRAVSQMDQVTQHNAALVEQVAAAAESLKSHAGTLVQAVSVFQLARGEQALVAPTAALPQARGHDEHPVKRPKASDVARPAAPELQKTVADAGWAGF